MSPKIFAKYNLQILKNLMQKKKRGGTASLLLLPFFFSSNASRPAAPGSPADKKRLCNKMARRHRHTQQGKEPRCPRPPPPLLHRGRSQSPDRSPHPQGRGVSRKEGRGLKQSGPAHHRRRAHTWPGWGWEKLQPGLRPAFPLSRLTPPRSSHRLS